MIVEHFDDIRVLAAGMESGAQHVPFRTVETGSQLGRIVNYACIIASDVASQYGLPGDSIEYISRFAAIHDIGCTAIPDALFLKPGPLSPNETRIMQTHPRRGLDIVNRLLHCFHLHSLPHMEILRNIVLHHHERTDGTGYPGKRKGKDIPVEARIVAVADVFNALTSRRPYRPAYDNHKALAELTAQAGITLDATCVAALRTRLDNIVAVQNRYQEGRHG